MYIFGLRFWLAITGGILAFAVVNVVNDVPHRIELGEQARLADRVLDDLRGPLLALEHAEIFVNSDHAHDHEQIQFNETVLELNVAMQQYLAAAKYNPEVAGKARTFKQSITDWLAYKQAELLSESAAHEHRSAVAVDREKKHKLLHAQVELGLTETFIHNDLLDSYAAIQLLQTSGAVLLAYFLAMIIFIQSRRTREVVRALNERKQTQKSISESRQMLALVLDSVPIRVFWKDRNSVYLGCNRLFAEDAGLSSSEQVVGRDDFSMPWKEQAERYRAHDKITMNSGLARFNYEETQTTSDGHELALRTSKVPLRDIDGRILGVLACYEDITKNKLAEKELQAHRYQLEEVVRKRTREVQLQAQIIDQIHDSVVSTDLDGRVTSWNKGAENLFGYSAKEAIGRPISFVYPEKEHEFLQQQVIVPLKNHGEHEAEVTMRRKNGEVFQALLSLSMLHDDAGVPVGMIGYSLDITDRKKAEETLIEQTRILEAANRELEAFSYSVSHDLRAPLRAIDGFSKALLDDYADSLDATGKDHLNRVRNAAQRMARLIDDLLNLSRISRHELRYETVDISALADSAIQKLREHDATRSVKVTIEPGMKAIGDSRLLEMVLDNLIGNAWKYTSRLDEAEIDIASRKDGEETVFYVRDNGAGFDMRYVDKLFGTFQRLHSSEFEGTGIGLATVRRIVRRHGGRVWGEGETDKGAIFYFTLPSPLPPSART